MHPFSIVIPVYNEGERIAPFLQSLEATILTPHETLVVYDMPTDTTVPFLQELMKDYPSIKPLHNTYGRGPAQALRYGFDHASHDTVVVTMGDNSDDASQIPELASLIHDDVVIAAGSRYMRGGKHLGGPPVKNALSKLADLSLWYLGRVGTHDATSAFKAYSKPFVQEVGIDSTRGFEMAIELVAKAKRHGKRVAEIPTTWRDRTAGESHFKVVEWLPHYLRWYVHALGPRRSLHTPPSRTAH